MGSSGCNGLSLMMISGKYTFNVFGIDVRMVKERRWTKVGFSRFGGATGLGMSFIYYIAVMYTRVISRELG